MTYRISPKGKEAYSLFHSGMVAFAQIERTGMCIDVDYCRRTSQQLTERMEQCKEDFKNSDLYKLWKKTYLGRTININSDAQLRHILFDVLKLKSPRVTKKGANSVDAESLLELGHPDIVHLITIRKLQKMRDTYLSGFLREQVNGVLHPFFNLNTVVTFRGSSSNINFQNIPKRDKEAMELIRKAIIPRKGHQLLEVDFSGIEVRISACYHKDPVMLRYIKDSSTDMHRDMAIQLLKLNKYDSTHPGDKQCRGAAKNAFVFPQFYGDYYKACAANLQKWLRGIPEISTGSMKEHLIKNKIYKPAQFERHVEMVEKDFWYRRFKVYQKWKEDWVASYLRNGYIDMYTGFRCHGPMSNNEVINYPVQGSAFHCLLWCLIVLQGWLIKKKLITRIIGQIHDAMVLDVHPSELDIVAKMIKKITTVRLLEHFKWICVPMDVEAELCPVDGSWNTKEVMELPQVRAIQY